MYWIVIHRHFFGKDVASYWHRAQSQKWSYQSYRHPELWVHNIDDTKTETPSLSTLDDDNLEVHTVISNLGVDCIVQTQVLWDVYKKRPAEIWAETVKTEILKSVEHELEEERLLSHIEVEDGVRTATMSVVKDAFTGVFCVSCCCVFEEILGQMPPQEEIYC